MIAINPVPTVFTDEFRAKFLARIQIDDGCWNWTGSRTSRGYGEFRRLCASRVAYSMFRGVNPEGMYVCHTCDNRLCVNPSHLFLGSCLDNVRDCIAKGRARRGTSVGTKNGNAVLNEEAVRQIRSEYEQLKCLSKVGRLHGVCPATIKQVVSRRTWRHVL